MEGARPVRAARGRTLTARSWQTEAPLRMLCNNLDPEVAERPDDLVVYGGTGRAATSGSRLFCSIRSGASVCQLRAVSVLPRGDRTGRAPSMAGSFGALWR